MPPKHLGCQTPPVTLYSAIAPPNATSLQTVLLKPTIRKSDAVGYLSDFVKEWPCSQIDAFMPWHYEAWAYDQQKRLIKPDAEIAPGLRTMALPGPTPGHIGLRVDSGNEGLLFWEDVVIAPTYQFANHDWAFARDTDQRAAAATRKEILDEVATDRVMVAGAHLDFPGFGYVDRAEQGYRFVSAPWDYRI